MWRKKDFTENTDIRFMVKKVCVSLGAALFCLCVLTGCGAKAGQSVCLNASLGEDMLEVYAKEEDEVFRPQREERIQPLKQEEKEEEKKPDKEEDKDEKDILTLVAAQGTDAEVKEEATEQEAMEEASETSVTYCNSMEEDEIRIADRITLTAQGDRVVRIDEILTVDLSFYEQEIQDLFSEAFVEITKQYQETEGVMCQSSSENGFYKLEISVDAESEAVAELADQGLLIVDGSKEQISLEETMKGLEDEGYEREERMEITK